MPWLEKSDAELAPVDEEAIKNLYTLDPRGIKVWNDTVKDYAYHVWANLTNQNAARTSLFLRYPPTETDTIAQIADIDLMPPLDVPLNMIQMWVRRDNWQQRLQIDFRTTAPEAWNRIRNNLMGAADYGSAKLMRAMQGLDSISKEEVTGLTIALDRIGMTPYIQPNTNQAPRGPKKESTLSLEDATREQLGSKLRELAAALEDTSPIKDAQFIELPTD